MRQLPRRLVDALGGRVELGFRAPARANLIGEHTDYNQGFVLPVALDVSTYVAGHAGGSKVTLTSLEESGHVVVDIAAGTGPTDGWGRYVTAVVRALIDAGIPLRGFTGAIASEVPTGAGLSSSAALEVAVASAIADEPLDPLRLARICRRAENDYVGVRSGIMDQLAVAGCRAGAALLVDCRDETMRTVDLPGDVLVLVIHCGVERNLGDSSYNQRRAECERAAQALGVASLRDADIDLLQAKQPALDDLGFRRARHVITENERVLDAVAALGAGDLGGLGDIFAASHRSLADDYEVSIPELDTLVEVARDTDGVHAARLTGAGFGGCTVQLVDRAGAEQIAETVSTRYRAETGREPRWWVSGAAAGATQLPLG